MNNEIREKPDEELEEVVEEGGSIRGIYEDIPFLETKLRAETSRRLAFWLVGILGGSFFIHYFTLVILESLGKSGATKTLSETFSMWLPVISGLASAAVTYYFTREKA
jgi:hypothetical protein